MWKNLNPNIRSWLNSLIIIFIIFFAIKGIIRLLWNSKDDDVMMGRIKFVFILLFVFSLLFIVSIYHIVGPYKVDIYYKIFIITFLVFIVVGLIYNQIYNLRFQKSEESDSNNINYKELFDFYKAGTNKKSRMDKSKKVTHN